MSFCIRYISYVIARVTGFVTAPVSASQSIAAAGLQVNAVNLNLNLSYSE